MTSFQDQAFNYSAFWAINITSTSVQFILSLLLVRWGDGLAQWFVLSDAAVLPLGNPPREKALFDTVVKFLGVLWLFKGIPDLLTTTARIGFHWEFLKKDQAKMTDFSYPIETILIGIALLAFCHFLVEYAYHEPKTKITVSSSP